MGYLTGLLVLNCFFSILVRAKDPISHGYKLPYQESEDLPDTRNLRDEDLRNLAQVSPLFIYRYGILLLYPDDDLKPKYVSSIKNFFYFCRTPLREGSPT